ncbi:hypothetical protein H1V43_36615 [Streptomyces sp. PSKA54]|uniref:Uncharacterized protein n=1 Tax=Streptomyces himalayensis subsp. aureolus TaxID=2758039 RepID=A0A7W2D8G2_9ACTN|nr:hypothetical protein [Streptomyces himalayensis subsp. aureolus]
MWATDRYRIALQNLPWQALSEETVGKPVVTAKALLDTAKAIAHTKDVTLALPKDDTLIGITGESLRATSRSLEGDLPAYDKLMPKPDQAEAVLTVDTAVFTQAVKRVALVASENKPVLLEFDDNTVTIRGGTSDDAQATDRIDAALEGGAMSVAFNPRFLLDGLTSIEAAKTQINFTSHQACADVRRGRWPRRRPLSDHAGPPLRLTRPGRRPAAAHRSRACGPLCCAALKMPTKAGFTMPTNSDGDAPPVGVPAGPSSVRCRFLRQGAGGSRRALSSQTPTSRCRSTIAGRQVRARESPPGAGRAATGTRVALRPRSCLLARQRVRP